MAADPLRYIDGITYFTYKKIVKHWFGKERFIKLIKNYDAFTLDFYLHKYINGEEIEKETIEYFNECWGNRIVIKPVD